MSHPVKFRPNQVEPGVFIAPGARVSGDVWLAAQSSVWFGAVIRGDTDTVRVGPRSNIQDNCVLHADPGFACTIGEGCTIGHGAIVHGATLGNNIVVGMKAVVQNGAIVGDDCIIAVGAVLTEGQEIPAGSLVMGMPAKVKRPLTEMEIARNRLGADHYVELSQEYIAEGD